MLLRMDRTTLVALLQGALKVDLPPVRYFDPAGHTPASVLILFAFSKTDLKSPRILFTERTHTVETHRGQLAFPGGVQDSTDVDAIHASLRETQEETGIRSHLIHVFGKLPEISTMTTKFLVTPVVGLATVEIESISVEPNHDEIAGMFWAPLKHFQAPENFRVETFEKDALHIKTPVYFFEHHRIWGATAVMLKSLLDRMSKL